MKIASASEDIIRAILIALCQDPVQEKKARDYFVELHRFRSKQLGGEDNDPANPDKSNENGGCTNGNESSKRRAISEIRICSLCKEPFNENENTPDTCLYHSGYMEVGDDSSIWEEWEDWRDGNPESAENKEQYPEGYKWSCCEEPIESTGCTRGSHKTLHKKQHY
ncbi:hypothetical protein ANO14919_118250 [Xylariales sp. No.14919]|nr:hypothetical protein ANO14919_118250 [Xylariales sp. No.14919]